MSLDFSPGCQFFTTCYLEVIFTVREGAVNAENFMILDTIQCKKLRMPNTRHTSLVDRRVELRQHDQPITISGNQTCNVGVLTDFICLKITSVVMIHALAT
jgi:hypothetical protein